MTLVIKMNSNEFLNCKTERKSLRIPVRAYIVHGRRVIASGRRLWRRQRHRLKGDGSLAIVPSNALEQMALNYMIFN